METKVLITGGIIGAIISLAALGGYLTLTQDQIDKSYFCPLTGEIGIFERLSDSGKTGYFLDELGEEQGIPCRSGRTYQAWIPLAEYAKANGISIESLLASNTVKTETYEPISLSNSQAAMWGCSTPPDEKCVLLS